MRDRLLAGALALCLGAACSPEKEPAGKPDEPDPRQTAERLLEMHELVGKHPEQRSEKSRSEPVPEERLRTVIADLDARDPFLSELYTGFVVGALARAQEELFVERRGAHAVVWAGRARIVMQRRNDRWKVVLDKSVPEAVKRRAAEEKRRFEQKKSDAGPR
jgi:hypothetical protein